MKLKSFLRQAARESYELRLELVDGQIIRGVPGILEIDPEVDAVALFHDDDDDYPTIVVIEHVVTAKRTGRVVKALP